MPVLEQGLASYAVSTGVLSPELKQPDRRSEYSSKCSINVRNTCSSTQFLLTPCIRFLLGKLVVAQLVMKSPRNVSADRVAPLLCMLHVQDSDLRLETVALSGSLQSPKLNAVIITHIRLRPLPHLVQSVIHWSCQCLHY